jgi:Flp pilus assembly protein TadB
MTGVSIIANYATAARAMETETRGGVERLHRKARFLSRPQAVNVVWQTRMRFLRNLHLYLGCLFAPILIFFAVTGSWQLFNWHESKKDKTYTAPPALAALSFVHKDAHIPGTPGRQRTPLRYFMLAAAAGLIATSVIGIVMAYRFSQRPIVATVCVLAGIALPALFLWIYR